MVADYYDATGNKTFLKEVIPWMDQEMSWWTKNRALNVKLPSGQKYQMYQYKVSISSALILVKNTKINLSGILQALSTCPRPENYLTDLDNGLKGTGDPEFIWSSIASACESGFDFSTRWFAHQGKYAGEFCFHFIHQLDFIIKPFQIQNIRSGLIILYPSI